ncbi:MAG: T9SS type A sorting domain-containing protein [bacterium]
MYRLKQIDMNGQYSYSDVIEVSAESIPGRFALEQNYPNPFNPTTVIKYQIPSSQVVTLKIYDILGNEVATLVHETKAPGNYEVKFDARSYGGSKLSSGVYFYQLRAGSFVSSKKFVLMK